MTHRFVASPGGVVEFSGDDPLEQARKREEILSAQLYALNNVSELFEITGRATVPPEVRKALREAWRMTELRAQVVIEMQVQRFTKIERLRVSDQLTALREFIAAKR